MINTLRQAVNNCITGKDNKTEDILRVCGALGFFGLLLYMFAIHPSFMEACTGLGVYITTWGSAILIKATTEPGEKKDD